LLWRVLLYFFILLFYPNVWEFLGCGCGMVLVGWCVFVCGFYSIVWICKGSSASFLSPGVASGSIVSGPRQRARLGPGQSVDHHRHRTFTCAACGHPFAAQTPNSLSQSTPPEPDPLANAACRVRQRVVVAITTPGRETSLVPVALSSFSLHNPRLFVSSVVPPWPGRRREPFP